MCSSAARRATATRPATRPRTVGSTSTCRSPSSTPEYVVCWGSVAAKNLLDTTQSIGKLRGRFHEHGTAKVLCTYHPSYLLRNPAAKKDVWNDMQFLFRDMGVELKPSS